MSIRKTIPLHLIDEPEIAMRVEIPDNYLRELADNIKEIGLINPISVVQTGERYSLKAGHCRFLAHRLMEAPTIEANDFTGDNVDFEAIKISENLCRLDVTDAEMATYLAELQQKHHYDIETLMRLTRRSEGWINMRLSLFNGDQRIFEALQSGVIKLGHAVVLNRFPDNFRAQYLQAVVNSTPPVKVLEQWLIDLRKMGIENLEQPAEMAQPTTDVPLPGVVLECCWVCGADSLPWTMLFPRIHQHCKEMIERQIDAASK